MTEMHRDDWVGVMPAITTPFDEDFEINLEFMRRHARQMVDAGCTGMVTPGSLGEGGLLLIPLPAAATAAPAAPAILLLLRPRGICYGSSATHPESITS